MSGRRSYEVLQTVGIGGMGTVYRARLQGEGDFAKEVALKVLSRELEEGDDIARRLRDEARILGLIRHRAVVNVDGLVSLDGCWTVVMEYVDGLDLKQLADRVGGLPESCALQVVGEVAGALNVAYHTAGPDGRELRLLHRDIKPANIQITTAGEVKVLDFGVARADFDAREAKTQSLAFGSLGYVAQERIDGIDVPAGDVYSLGVVLYELLSGARFGQTFLHERRHEGRLNDKEEVLAGKGVSEGTRALVRDMLSFRHANRPDAREVERRCEQHRTGGPSLRDWAEEFLPVAVEAARGRVEQGEFVGRVLVEEAPSETGRRPHRETVPVVAPASSSPGCMPSALMGVVAVLVVLVALTTLVVVGLGGMVAGSFLF
jgi:eukaryotic-like serine/threonine-protein kinase